MTELKRRILEDIVENVSQAKYNDVAPLLLRAKGRSPIKPSSGA